MLKCEGGKWPHFDVKPLESHTQELAGTLVQSLSVLLHARFHFKVIIYSLLTQTTGNYVKVGVTNAVTG